MISPAKCGRLGVFRFWEVTTQLMKVRFRALFVTYPHFWNFKSDRKTSRWTIACALLALRSSSEPIPCAGFGKDVGDSPGALDANVRLQFDLIRDH